MTCGDVDTATVVLPHDVVLRSRNPNPLQRLVRPAAATTAAATEAEAAEAEAAATAATAVTPVAVLQTLIW
jgi:hypothetical protein